MTAEESLARARAQAGIVVGNDPLGLEELMELRPFNENRKKHSLSYAALVALIATKNVGVRKGGEHDLTPKALADLFKNCADGQVMFSVEEDPAQKYHGKTYDEEWTIQGVAYVLCEASKTAHNRVRRVPGTAEKRRGLPVYDAFFD